MFFFVPIVAAILQAGSFVIDKKILNIPKVNHREYMGVSFPLIFLITLGIFLIIRPSFDVTLLLGGGGLLLCASIFLSMAANLLYYRALESDLLSEVQMIGLLGVIPVVIGSSIIFSDERNFAIIIPTIIASLAIVWSHWSHHKIKIAPHTIPYLCWTLAAPLLSASLSKILLTSWHPISLEMIRAGAMAILVAPMYAYQSVHTPKSAIPYLALTNILTSVAWILFYISYQKLGIIYTLLLFSLQPVLVYASAILILREPLVKKKVVGFVIVIICVITAQILK